MINNNVSILDPMYITGIIDGEGSFNVSISKSSTRSLGYVITFSFEIGLHNIDLNLLKQIQAYFQVGGIYKHSNNMMRYKVSSFQNIIKVIIPHFLKYPLITQKRVDFEIFKNIINIINNGPLSLEDLQKIVNLKASLNTGNSDELQKNFPNTFPAVKPLVKYKGIPDPY